MATRWRHFDTGRYGAWRIALLLLAILLLPTLGVLWFMTEAIRNQRIAVRQKLTEIYESELDFLGRQVDAFFSEKQAALGEWKADQPDSQVFADLVHAGTADSVVVLDLNGRAQYPTVSSSRSTDVEAVSTQWLEAWRLEFTDANAKDAAAAYAQIAAQAQSADAQARAMVAQCRCLIKGGYFDDAVDTMVGPLVESRYRHSTNEEGNLIVPAAQLSILQALGRSSPSQSDAILARLTERILDYGDPALPSVQRVFLMQQLRTLFGDDCPGFPTYEAELLAADYLAAGMVQPLGSRLVVSRLDDVWQLASREKTVVALFRTSRVGAEVRSLIGAHRSIPNVSVMLRPPSSSASDEEVFLVADAGDTLKDWQLELRSLGADPFADAAGRRTLVYLWTGMLVVAAIAISATLVARYVSVQLEVARLKNSLISTVSHELKTPIASTRALADSLLSGHYRDETQRKEYLQLIAQENERLSRLIDNFLAFSRMERSQQTFVRDVISLDGIVADALEQERERLHSPECNFRLQVESELPSVEGDATALTTVLVNLLNNAHKYSGADKDIALRAYAENCEVCIDITDNGVGISPRSAKKVFERFYREDDSLSRSTGGCGLGLSIVKFIVQAHGGSVGLVSEIGKGSTFTVRLPGVKSTSLAQN